MFTGLQRHVGIQHAPHLVAPHARAVDHHITGNVPLIAGFVLPSDPCNPTTVAGDACDLGAFGHHRALLARALGHGQRDIGRISLTVSGQPDTAGYVIDIDMFVARLDLGRGQFLHRDPKGTGHGGITVQLLQTFISERDRNRTHLPHPCGNASFRLKPHVKLRRIARQLGHVGAGPQLSDQPRRMPCGTRGELFAFQQDHISPTKFSEVIGHRAADHATADDDHLGLSWNGHWGISCVIGRGGRLFSG